MDQRHRQSVGDRPCLEAPREKRPADVIGNAVKVMRIATGGEDEAKTDDGKDKAAVSLGKRGGIARAKKISAMRRSEIAKKAADSRWKG
jgi:hypothetical protein